ncbi:LysR family transcriptional regulator [Enterococcus rivorum]|uniref:LysR family transcriptional regulator n=1 Tax=Enterococcus rivorum TaxID=762845 RepID=A0A1E5KX29_9ENTE|nr:LysR family transcriptional regulator [Enterococcus rivorum]MBP2100021.1 DNA-binding transcriptional LysR family regulator [Enterococcus rivorum]OEH82219.1 LysR family transcriptional regulator [Enterococcus rivorum]
MNIQQMKYVVAVANNGSFREAAKKLFITQPSLSNGIRELEEKLGVTLFTRTNKGASLTKDGLEFLEYAETILTQIELMESRYQEVTTSERFSISSQHYDFLGEVMAKVIKKFEKDYKNFRLFETTTLKVIEDVKSFHSELGVIYLNEQNKAGIVRYLEQANLSYEIIGYFKTHIFLGKNHPLAKKEVIKLEELCCYPQVRFAQEGSNFAYFSEDLIENQEQETVIYTNDRGTLMNILVETNAYASGSGLITGYTKKEICLVPLANSPENKICILTQKKRSVSKIGSYFVNELKRLF